MTKKLKNKIQKQLTKLSQLLDKIDEARIINPEDPETWDSDILYNLTQSLKETLKLLEDQTIKGKFDDFGQSLTEPGLCSLIDYLSEEDYDY